MVTVVICTYNRASVLPLTLESVFAQRYRPVEILVLDDGSTDETPDVLRAYSDRILYHRLETNTGIARARTEACRLANGRYIAFQDDDDLMPHDRLEVLTSAFEAVPDAAFAVGDLELIDDEGQPTGVRWLPATDGGEPPSPRIVDDGYREVLWPTLPVVPHTTLFQRRDGDRIGWFDSRFSHAAEDKDFFARLARLGPVVYVPKVVSWVRRGHQSLTRDTLRTEHDALELYAKHMALVRQTAPVDWELYRRLQRRISTSLERIARQRTITALPDELETRFLTTLSPTLRLRYLWRTRLRHPMRLVMHRLRPATTT